MRSRSRRRILYQTKFKLCLNLKNFFCGIVQQATLRKQNGPSSANYSGNVGNRISGLTPSGVPVDVPTGISASRPRSRHKMLLFLSLPPSSGSGSSSLCTQVATQPALHLRPHSKALGPGKCRCWDASHGGTGRAVSDLRPGGPTSPHSVPEPSSVPLQDPATFPGAL